MREELVQACEEPLQFLDPRWDPALLGWGARAIDGPVVLYSYQKLLGCAEGGPIERFQQVNQLFKQEWDEPSVPICLVPIPPGHFWKEVRAKRLPVWDRMNRAIMGVGFQLCSRGVSMTVYSWETCIEISIRETRTVDETPEEFLHNTIEWFDHSIIQANLGPSTPLFVYP